MGPSDPGAISDEPAVAPAAPANASFASPRLATTSSDIPPDSNQSDRSLATGAHVIQQQQQQSSGGTAAEQTTEWYAHNPKLYLLRYSEQFSMELDWQRGHRGPEHHRQFFVTLRVPLPGMLAEPLCETASSRTKREAEGEVATAACRTLFRMGLLEDPQEKKKLRGRDAKKLKTLAPPIESANSEGVRRVRLSASPLKMRIPHMKGLEACNHEHHLPDPLPVILPTRFVDRLAELEHLEVPDVPLQSHGISVDAAFTAHYHCNPTLSPTEDPSQWQHDASARTDDPDNVKAVLPICAMKDQLVKAMRKSQVVLVSGPSGSGKSTQICQYIMDDWEKHGHGNLCSVVQCCSETVLAESVANRVAAERSTPLGTCVGFHTLSSQKIPALGTDGARVIFTTIAMLMHRLQCDPFLADTTHIIVDGVDTRTVRIDILLTYTRTLLSRRNALRLILLAHNGDEDCRHRMQNYFNNFVCVEITGTPVEVVRASFLEEVLLLTQPDEDCSSLRALTDALDMQSEVDLSLVIAVIAYIVASSVDGGILVFMPSAESVDAVLQKLTSTAPFSDTSRFSILPLDATVEAESVQLVYDQVGIGVRKIIVATSIAEREIPIDGIEYVVDTGRTQKRMHISLTSATTCSDVVFATRAACQRRRATATRGRHGWYFCLLSADRAGRLQQEEQPEMTRTPLTEAILLIQNLQLGNVAQFLALTPDPPSSQAVGESVRRLHAIGALERETDELTPLGRKLAQISFLHPCIGKLLIIGTLFSVRDEALTIAAALSVKPVLNLPDGEERTQTTAIHQRFGSQSFSDHYTVLCAYNSWVKARQEVGEVGGIEFSTAHCLSETNLRALHSRRQMLAEALATTGVVALPAAMAARREELTSSPHELGHLLQAAITSSLMPTILQVTQGSGDHMGCHTHDNCRILLHPSSVNATRACCDLPSPWLVFSSPMQQHQSDLSVRETTAANVAAMLVLTQGETWERVDTPMGAEIVISDWVRFVCPVVGTFRRVRDLREHLGVAVARVLSYPKHGPSCEYVRRVFEIALPFLAIDLCQSSAGAKLGKQTGNDK